MKKTIFLSLGVIVAVLVLGGAAFVGGSLLRGQGLPVPGLGTGQQMVFAENGKPVQTLSLNLQPAKELPQTTADAKGVFVRRQDNSIFIGTGKVRLQVQKQP